MDEQAWLTGEDFYQMVEHLRLHTNMNRTKAGRRKFRLFSCACARRVRHLMNEPCRDLVVGVEQFLDGKIGEGDVEKLHQAVMASYQQALAASPAEAVAMGVALSPTTVNRGYAAIWAIVVPRYPAQMTFSAAAAAAGDLANVIRAEQGQDAAARFLREEPRRQTDLLREIVGNPFRPLPKRKFPAEVRGLAQSAYEDHAHYPLLADALADLGEDEAAAHCRLPDHVKGCHVVDWILGKA